LAPPVGELSAKLTERAFPRQYVKFYCYTPPQLFFQILQNFGIGHQHAFVHFAVHFTVELWIGDHKAYQIHGKALGPLLLGEVILTVFLEELVVSPHEAPHLVNKIPEDLHTANTVEVLGTGIFVFQGIVQIGGKGIDGSIGVNFIGGDTGKDVAAHLGATSMMVRRFSSLLKLPLMR